MPGFIDNGILLTGQAALSGDNLVLNNIIAYFNNENNRINYVNAYSINKILSTTEDLDFAINHTTEELIQNIETYANSASANAYALSVAYTNALTLDGLSDVIITTPTTDQVLKYNGVNWVNGAPASGGGVTEEYVQSYANSASANALLFANITTATATGSLQNQINDINVIGGPGIGVTESPIGTFIVSVSGSYATLSQVNDATGNSYIQSVAYTNALTLDGLSDVIITTPTTDQVLKYNGVNWVNGAPASGGGVTEEYVQSYANSASANAYNLSQIYTNTVVGNATGALQNQINNLDSMYVNITGDTIIGQIIIDVPTQSESLSSGALIISGGAVIGGNEYIGGKLVITDSNNSGLDSQLQISKNVGNISEKNSGISLSMTNSIVSGAGMSIDWSTGSSNDTAGYILGKTENIEYVSLQPIEFIGETETLSITTSLTVNVPSGTNNGDLLIAMISKQMLSPERILTPPAGWTEIDNSPQAPTDQWGYKQHIYYRIANTEPASYTWTTNSAAFDYGIIAAYRNVDQLNPISNIGYNINNSWSTTVDSPTTNITTANSWIITTCSTRGGTGSLISGPNSPYTRRDTFDQEICYFDSNGTVSLGNNSPGTFTWNSFLGVAFSFSINPNEVPTALIPFKMIFATRDITNTVNEVMEIKGNGQVKINSNIQSTSISSGALVIENGGIGISGNAYIGGDIYTNINNGKIIISDINGKLISSDNDLPDIYRTEVVNISSQLYGTIVSTSGSLQSQINDINVIGGNGIDVTESPTNTFIVSVSGDYTTLSQVNSASANAYIQSISYINSFNDLAGYINLTTNDAIYTVTHPVSSSLPPIIQLITPISGSTLYIEGIFNVNNNGFSVEISDTPDVTGFQLFWKRSISNNNITISQSLTGSLNDLSDVIITNPITDQVLKYNGVNWVNGAPVSGGGGVTESYVQSYANSTSANAYTQSQSYTNTIITNTTGSLQSQINDINVIGGSGIGVTESPVGTFIVSVSGDYATLSQVNSATGNAYTQAVALIPTTLNDLSDVTITTPIENQVLKYNGVNWVNGSATSGGGANILDDLSDVTITTPLSGQILSYNGTQWVNRIERKDFGFAIVSSTTITSGTKDTILTSPYNGTLIDWYLTVNPSGSVVMDILKNNADIPVTSIITSGGPTITSNYFNSGIDLSGWNTTVNKGDNFKVKVLSNTASTSINLNIGMSIKGL